MTLRRSGERPVHSAIWTYISPHRSRQTRMSSTSFHWSFDMRYRKFPAHAIASSGVRCDGTGVPSGALYHAMNSPGFVAAPFRCAKAEAGFAITSSVSVPILFVLLDSDWLDIRHNLRGSLLLGWNDLHASPRDRFS